MLDNARAGDLPEVYADIEALRFHGLLEGVDAAAGLVHELEHFLVGERREIGHLAIGADEDMAAVVGKGVEDRVTRLAAVDDVVREVVARLRDAGENRFFRARFFGTEDVIDTPRGDERFHGGGR